MPPFSLYGPTYGDSGNLLQDPVIPAVSGLSVLKVALALGVFVWIFRSLGRKG